MEKDELMMKAATAALVGVGAILMISLVVGWIAIIIMSLAFIWAGVTTVATNLTLAVAEVIVGAFGLIISGFILLLYVEHL